MMLGDGGEDSGLVSGGASLVVSACRSDDVDDNSRGVARFAILLGAMEDLRLGVDEIYDGARRRKLTIYVSGGDDEDANLACGISEVEDEGGFAWRSWRLR
ncbi:uncharacterized protein HKW66_Vig0007780 [Vigna angularis]|uniref:Uncharacterized protein n=1 Tax=Phaseolus angularis TaxID=3914 RepID=A0A8T0LHZ3_PHAAN|nr:uncharacterized protein HKW66_Vig0007780 [Vigna angularis]